ncbi:aminotransferase class IV [Weissella confusa]|uniref:Aminotransferase class IV n=1 Tax=Weissella confusa TaxID=1583 RepID=A0A923SSV2_WEICO|nr:aminotransferase class IV [Weissella confusa]
MPVEERAFTKEELLTADEVFITSSLLFAGRVVSIDGQAAGQKAGELFIPLRERLETLNLLPNVLSAQRAAEAGVDETVYYRICADGSTRVTEGSHTNVHMIKDGKLVTAPTDKLILPGIACKVSNETYMVYWQVTRGSGERHHSFPKDAKPNLFVTITPMTVTREAQTRDFRIQTEEDIRSYMAHVLEDMMIPATDRGYYFGDGVYDATVVRHHKLFALDEHLDRFWRSMDAVMITPDFTKDELATLLNRLSGHEYGCGVWNSR